MASEAKILREQGIEGLRAFWREKANRRYQRVRKVAIRTCQWCEIEFVGTPARSFCSQTCAYERALERGRLRKRAKRWSRHIIRACPTCGKEFELSHGQSKKVYCQPDHRPVQPSKWGLALPLRYATCAFCRRLMVLHGTKTLCLSDACLREQNRIASREYMRLTHYAAARYWRIADTPEAKQLAYTYDQLRRLVRSKRNG